MWLRALHGTWLRWTRRARRGHDHSLCLPCVVMAMRGPVFFTLMLFILLAGFSMMALQFFGSTIDGYSSVPGAVLQLILVLLGQFDVQGMKQASIFGVPFFFVYIIVMFLIMMNIFLAILGEAYTVVRSDNDEIIASRVKTKRRSLLSYLRLARAVVKAKLKQRRARKLAAKGVAGRRSAELPSTNGLEMQPVGDQPNGAANGAADGGGGKKSVTFKS